VRKSRKDGRNVTEKRIGPEEFDSTTAAVNQGVRSLAIERAVSEVEGWQKRLEASNDPLLQPIADNLGALKELLTAETLDGGAIGRLLVDLGDQTQAVAVSGKAAPVADRLQLLSQLLTDEGRSVVEEVERSTTEGEAPGGR
jgi:hypothetical protein